MHSRIPSWMGAVSLVAAASAGPSLASAANASGQDAVTIEVRVYDQGTHDPGLVDALQQSVRRILGRVRINVAFVDCVRSTACRDVPAADTLVLRLAPGLHPMVARQCGAASMGDGRQRGVLMTIFRGCAVETLNELRGAGRDQGGVFLALLTLTEADVLAVFAIHELIHLALPGEAHGRGLFKAALDARDWWDIASRRPYLDTHVFARLRQALATDKRDHRASVERADNP